MTVKLKTKEKVKILCSDDIYFIMQWVLLRENKIDRNREHVWTISLDNANKILNIELVSMGSINQTIVEPMEVFSVPLQKRAVTIILAHNHPSGELDPSEADKDITDRLIQCGLILHVPLKDHLIISEASYYSFADSGLLAELERSKKYVPDYKIRAEIKKSLAREMARVMKANGESVAKIVQYTGLDKKAIGKIRMKSR